MKSQRFCVCCAVYVSGFSEGGLFACTSPNRAGGGSAAVFLNTCGAIMVLH